MTLGYFPGIQNADFQVCQILAELSEIGFEVPLAKPVHFVNIYVEDEQVQRKIRLIMELFRKTINQAGREMADAVWCSLGETFRFDFHRHKACVKRLSRRRRARRARPAAGTRRTCQRHLT
tara:strand:- start:122 stop:484 length:363 start_codon:yes stop_codon:yes gene_type:complete